MLGRLQQRRGCQGPLPAAVGAKPSLPSQLWQRLTERGARSWCHRAQIFPGLLHYLASYLNQTQKLNGHTMVFTISLILLGSFSGISTGEAACSGSHAVPRRALLHHIALRSTTATLLHLRRHWGRRCRFLPLPDLKI